MMIDIYDENLNILGVIEDYESLIFTRKFYKYGEFELVINMNKQYTDKLEKFNIIVLNNNFKKAGIILHKEIGLDEEGEPSEELFIKGYTLDGLTAFREIVPENGHVAFSGSQESIMKSFVDNCMINPTDIDRKINIINATNLNRGKQDRWRGRFELLSDKLEEVGLYSELGWEIYIDIHNKRFVFDVLQGVNRSSNQRDNVPAIFSMDFSNIASRQYTESVINSKTVIYAGGKGEEENKLIQKIGNAKGIRRIEGYADFSSADDVSELRVLGEQRLKELAEIETFEATVIPDNSFYYGEDYSLGDYVTVVDKSLNRKLDTQIIEVKEIYNENGFNIDIVFGKNIPDILDKIKALEKTQGPTDMAGQGEQGLAGVGINYTWEGTQLGVKREDEANYSYVNLEGKQGPKGDKGDTGPRGLQGEQGPRGLQGLKGDKGNDGYTPRKNIDYFDGVKGDQGIQGIKGDTGPKGEIGLTGPKGDKGDKGNPFIYSDFTTAQLNGLKVKGDKGDKGDTGPQGPQGLKGDTGTRGPQGIQGIQGLKGDKGDTGPQGPKGDAIADSVEWNKVLNKPNTFPPSSHSHISIRVPDTRNIDDKPLEIPSHSLSTAFKQNTSVANPPVSTGSQYAHILNMNGWTGANVGGGGHTTQVAFGDSLAIRMSTGLETWGPWKRLATIDDIQKTITSRTEPTGLKSGDQWHKEY